jgi:hypothetical protein
MSNECDFSYELKDDYFEAPTQEVETKSISSELPDGDVWKAKLHYNTVIYALVFATAGSFRLIKQLIETLSIEMNIYTSFLLLPLFEKSVGLPDTRLPEREMTLCERREKVRYMINKTPVVELIEMQERVDKDYPDYGIWLTTNEEGQSYRYTMRYQLGHGESKDQRFALVVNIPWFVIDPNDLDNSLITWDNLKSWLRDFVPSVDNIIPNYIEQASYCVITNPAPNDIVYIDRDPEGTWFPNTITWRSIDTDGTVQLFSDTEIFSEGDESITRSFIDSTSSVIEAENDIQIIPIL